MDKEFEKKLARSLGAEDARLIPFLPYLLQDLKNFGTPVKPIIKMLKEHIPNIASCKILDLGCGKGFVGLPITKETGAAVHFVDIMPDFVESVKTKAKEMNIANCSFATEDIRLTAKTARGFDIVLLCSVGDALGNSEATVKALSQTVKKGGYIIIEESYFIGEKRDLKCSFDCEMFSDWLNAFEKASVRIVAQIDEEAQSAADEINFDSDNEHIAKRAAELSERHPDKKELFDGFVQSQLNECDDLTDRLQTSIWFLQTEK